MHTYMQACMHACLYAICKEESAFGGCHGLGVTAYTPLDFESFGEVVGLIKAALREP